MRCGVLRTRSRMIRWVLCGLFGFEARGYADPREATLVATSHKLTLDSPEMASRLHLRITMPTLPGPGSIEAPRHAPKAVLETASSKQSAQSPPGATSSTSKEAALERRFERDWSSSETSLVDPLDPSTARFLRRQGYDRTTRQPTVDERSAWARWNADLPGVTATAVAFLCGMVAGFTLLPRDVTGWYEPEFRGLKGNFAEGPRFDNDRAMFNYVMHPIGGSEFYMMARNRKATWWQGLAYAAAMSTTFEFFIESVYERASWQDLWITPVSGAFLGELRWQAKQQLTNRYTGKPVGTWNKVLYVFIDPLDAIYKL